MECAVEGFLEEGEVNKMVVITTELDPTASAIDGLIVTIYNLSGPILAASYNSFLK